MIYQHAIFKKNLRIKKIHTSRFLAIGLLCLSHLFYLSWGFQLPEKDFVRASPVHSYFNLYYRFYQNQPSRFNLQVEGKIPFFQSEQSIQNLARYHFETTLGYAFIMREMERHNYFWEQSWYGDFLHLKIGYGYTHRVNPVTSYSHQLPLSLGGFFSRWEIKTFSAFNWQSDNFLPLFGGSIAYHFYTQNVQDGPKSEMKFTPFKKNHPFPHRLYLAVFQVSPTGFKVKNAYQFNVIEFSDQSNLRLFFSWEIFPLKVGLAISFVWADWGQIASHIRYQPQWGVDYSLEWGAVNYQTFYGNSFEEDSRIPPEIKTMGGNKPEDVKTDEISNDL